MDIAAIQAIAASLKTATEVVRGILLLRPTAEIQAKIVEIQSALLAAQNSALDATNAQFELRQRIRELEDRIAAFNDWTTQQQRYGLVAPWKGPAQAYALRKSHAAGDTPHLLCTNCFLKRLRTILSPQKSADGFINMVCPTCRAAAYTGFRGIGPAKFAEEYTAEQPTTP